MFCLCISVSGDKVDANQSDKRRQCTVDNTVAGKELKPACYLGAEVHALVQGEIVVVVPCV